MKKFKLLLLSLAFLGAGCLGGNGSGTGDAQPQEGDPLNGNGVPLIHPFFGDIPRAERPGTVPLGPMFASSMHQVHCYDGSEYLGVQTGFTMNGRIVTAAHEIASRDHEDILCVYTATRNGVASFFTATPENDESFRGLEDDHDVAVLKVSLASQEDGRPAFFPPEKSLASIDDVREIMSLGPPREMSADSLDGYVENAECTRRIPESGERVGHAGFPAVSDKLESAMPSGGIGAGDVVEQVFEDKGLIRLSALAKEGMAGGIVFDRDGCLLGMIVQGARHLEEELRWIAQHGEPLIFVSFVSLTE